MKVWVVLFSVCLVFAKTPEWVKNQGRLSLYPEALYLTGYGIATAANGVTEGEAVQAALGNARKNLIEKIHVTIQSVTSGKTLESGDTFSSVFSTIVLSTSAVDIQGLEYFQYFDDDVAYAFAFVKKDNLAEIYRNKISSLQKEIKQKLQLAASYERQNNSTKALDEYVLCYPLIRKAEEDQSVLAGITISGALTELERTASENEITSSQIQTAIAALVQRPIKTVDDLAWYLIYQINGQLSSLELSKKSVIVTPLYYQDTKMGSSFSRYFQQIIEQKSVEVAKWNPVTGGAEMILNGTYWEQSGKIKFIVTLRNITDGKILACAEAAVDSSLVSSLGKSIKPENYLTALTDRKIFTARESACGGMMLEGWTNMEQLGNLFVAGDTMSVFVRVNMPCYIRFVYHMADGKRVLLMNEYFIDQSKVNITYPIPIPFVCSAPFGSEVLQIFARTEKFESIVTKRIEGYEYLTEDLQTFITGARGMKAASPAVMQSEKRITITTIQD